MQLHCSARQAAHAAGGNENFARVHARFALSIWASRRESALGELEITAHFTTRIIHRVDIHVEVIASKRVEEGLVTAKGSHAGFRERPHVIHHLPALRVMDDFARGDVVGVRAVFLRLRRAEIRGRPH